MTLPRHPASRFFAAFYRWSIHNQQAQQCPISRTRSSRLAASLAQKSAYHTTPCLHQESTQEEADAHEAFLSDQHLAQGRGIKIVRHIAKDVPDRNVNGKLIRHKPVESKSKEGPNAAARTTTFSDATVDVEGLKEDMRMLMRKVPSSVAIITVRHKDPATDKCVPMGMPVSSLTTVTLDPPTICFNIKQPSQTLDAIKRARGTFRVHFLSTTPQAGKIVDLFSTGNNAEAYWNRLAHIGLHVPTYTKDPGGAEPSGAPVIFDPAVRAALECTVIKQMPVEDHVILVAKVNTLRNIEPESSTLIYYDRKCIRPGHPLAQKRRTPTPAASMQTPDPPALAESLTSSLQIASSKPISSVWEYSLFPGPEARQEFLGIMTQHMRVRPKPRDMSISDYCEKVESTLPLNPATFGISTYHLATANSAGAAPMAELYGRLDSFAMESIAKRAISLVRADEQYLTRSWQDFLGDLGVSRDVVNLLPSDITTPLRNAGLVGPLPDWSAPAPSKEWTHLEALEVLEQRLVKHISSLDFTDAVLGDLVDFLKHLGKDKSISPVFSRSRKRLLTLAHPDMFGSSKVDISGHATGAEAQVIVSRICRHIDNQGAKVIFGRNQHDLLRTLRIHPCVTGVNIEFIFAKLEHTIRSAGNQSNPKHKFEMKKKMYDMLKVDFTTKTSWEELSTRVREFVQQYPLRAITWDHGDKLAAMGFYWQATIDTQEGQSLAQGNVLDVMIAKELKDVYGKNGAEVDERIKEFLLEKYAFNVSEGRSEGGVEDEMVIDGESSADEMERAMLAGRRVHR